jgi:hypothetical protein
MLTMLTTNELMNILKPYFKIHKSRLNCFSQILIAPFTVCTVNLVELAQAVVCGSSEGRPIYAYRDFFSGFTGFTFENISKFLLSLFQLQGPWRLSIDRTNWRWGKVDINILMLSIKHGGIAIAIL